MTATPSYENAVTLEAFQSALDRLVGDRVVVTFRLHVGFTDVIGTLHRSSESYFVSDPGAGHSTFDLSDGTYHIEHHDYLDGDYLVIRLGDSKQISVYRWTYAA